jgi:ribulose-phosphate 3-epimerase
MTHAASVSDPSAPRNLFTQPGRLPLIAPSILSARFTHMAADCRHLLKGSDDAEERADLLHLDVMDGHFVPNLTMGPDMCRSLRHEFPDAFLDVHLMVTDPDLYVDPFLKAGANHLTFHVEVRKGDQARRLADRIHKGGATVGLAINPPTPVDDAIPLLDAVDLVLVMSVNPGFSGQAFISDVLKKTRFLRQILRQDQRLEMDGGIGIPQCDEVLESGCDVIVAASAIFNQPSDERWHVIRSLRG